MTSPESAYLGYYNMDAPAPQPRQVIFLKMAGKGA